MRAVLKSPYYPLFMEYQCKKNWVKIFVTYDSYPSRKGDSKRLVAESFPSTVGEQKIYNELTDFESRPQASDRVISLSQLQGQRQLLMAKILETQNRILGVVENEQEITKLNLNRKSE